MLARDTVHNPGVFKEYKENKNGTCDLDEKEIENFEKIDNDNYEIKDEKKEGANLKKQKSNEESKSKNSLRISNRLTTILAKKYERQEIDIIKYVKEYIEIVTKIN